MNPLEHILTKTGKLLRNNKKVDCETATHVHSGTGLYVYHFCMQFSPKKQHSTDSWMDK